jgi:hypothetical protein
VERPRVADEFELLRGGLGEPEGGLDRLGAAREELDPRQTRRRHRAQELEETRASLGREAPERQALGLRLQPLDVVRVAVTHAPDGDPGDEVDVFLAVLVVEAAARAASHRQARIESEGLETRRHVALLVFHDPARARARLVSLAGHFRHCFTPASGRSEPRPVTATPVS